jgi:hypothetical protein
MADELDEMSAAELREMLRDVTQVASHAITVGILTAPGFEKALQLDLLRAGAERYMRVMIEEVKRARGEMESFEDN